MTNSTIAALEERFISPDGSSYQTIGITREELCRVIVEVRLDKRGPMEKLYAASMPFQKVWALRAKRSAQTSGNEKRRCRDLEAGFYSVMDDDGERLMLTGQDLKNLAEAVAELRAHDAAFHEAGEPTQ